LRVRSGGKHVFANMRDGEGTEQIVSFLKEQGGL
jgi:Ni2+-binding GTPase involved in maturation of urease and hydrogenase